MAQMNLAVVGWMVVGVELLSWKATWTLVCGSLTGFVPAASRSPNTNRFGPTTVSDEMINGVNGRPPEDPDGADGTADVAGPPLPPGWPVQAIASAARIVASATQEIGRNGRRGCTRASYPGPLNGAFRG
jgi:hypothetical protein